MPSELSAKWDAKYINASCADVSPSAILNNNTHLLPPNGTALDYASGLGGNALMLARCGLVTHAWDISPIALEKLKAYSLEQQLKIITEIRDVEIHPPESQQFDVIVVTNFLHRPTFVNLINALRPGGLLFYQTFTLVKVSEQGPSKPKFLLKKNELLTLCSSLEILVYREEDKQGDITKGWRNQAMAIAKKP